MNQSPLHPMVKVIAVAVFAYALTVFILLWANRALILGALEVSK